MSTVSQWVNLFLDENSNGVLRPPQPRRPLSNYDNCNSNGVKHLQNIPGQINVSCHRNCINKVVVTCSLGHVMGYVAGITILLILINMFILSALYASIKKQLPGRALLVAKFVM